jgi:hypothetical protein
VLGAAISVSDLDDKRPVDDDPALLHVQGEAVAYKRILDEGPSADFLMGLHQCSLKGGALQIGPIRFAPAAVSFIIIPDRELQLHRGKENKRKAKKKRFCFEEKKKGTVVCNSVVYNFFCRSGAPD